MCRMMSRMHSILRAVISAFSILLASSCWSQLSATVMTAQSRVQGLQYSSAEATQYATWTFTVTPGGNYGHLTSIGWSVDGQLMQSYGSIESFTYTATSSGKHTISCYMSYAVGVTGTLTVAAIGGPLSLGVTLPPGMPKTFVHDMQDVSKPFYIQYFGYDHASPPTNSQIQLTQDGTVTPTLVQPTGTTETWSYGSLYCPQIARDSNSNYSTISLQADSSKAAVTVGCTFSYTDPVDPTLTGSTLDDTSSTPQSAKSGSAMMVNQFDPHAPLKTSLDQNEALTASTFGVNTSSSVGFTGTGYSIYLFDQQGQNMPGVWVNERFTSVPNGALAINVNSAADFWTTQMPNSTSKLYWNVDPSGVFEWDNIWFSYTIPATFSSLTAVHQYWAGSQSVSSNSPGGGVNVGSYTITYSVGSVAQVGS